MARLLRRLGGVVCLTLALTALAPPARAANVAPRGTATTLDVANWNVEWFGDTANAPTNDALQQANVRDTILGTDFDVWALEEVVSASAFGALVTGLPGYAGILSNDARVTSGASYYAASEQKVALLWKTSVASLVSARLVLTANDYDFGGRPPLEVRLSVTLNGATEERVFIVLHAKAMADATSWQRRSNGSAALEAYLDATFPTQKVIVLGDWNDDLDTSILAGYASPYENFLADDLRYDFPTWSLTQAGTATTCGYPDAIDHQLVTNEQYADLVAASVESYRVDAQLSGYCTTTSDHYPTLVRYQFGTGTPPPPPPPPPATGRVILNEILANEPGSSTAGEFVELLNVGGAAVDLSGWRLWGGTAARHVFPAGTVLAAGQAIVVFGGASGIPAGTPGAVASSTGTLHLGNSSDTVSLRDAAGSVVDSFAYSASLSGTDGVSMNRSPDTTPGAPMVLHTVLSSLKASPGRRVAGTAF